MSTIDISPRMILIEQYGLLVGLLTVKDSLKYTIAHEAASGHSSPSSSATSGAQELEQMLKELTIWGKELWVALCDQVVGRKSERVLEGAGDRRGSDDSGEESDEGIELRRTDRRDDG